MREKRKKCFCCAHAHKIALYVAIFFMFYAFMFYARIKWPPGPNFLCAHKTDTHIINIKRKSAYSTWNHCATKTHAHHTQQPTTRWAVPTLPSSGFALLSSWVEQRRHQIMSPPLPITIQRPRAVGVCSFGGSWHERSNNRERGDALALGGRQSIELNNNQPKLGGTGTWGVRAEACWAGSAWGDTIPSFGVANWSTKNI